MSLEYGSTARVCAPKKLLYHKPISPSSAGALASSGAVRKCSSTRWKPGQEVGEPLAADDGHHRQADRRVHRIASADPVPEAEHVVGVDAEVVDQLLVRRDRDEMLGHRGVAECVGQPAARCGRVGQRLQRGERLRRDDEKRCGGVESIELGHQVGGVDVGDEPRRDARVGVVAQRVVDHHRAQVRAADADVDDGLDALAGRARPLAAAQPVGEVAHLVQHRVHILDDVLAVDDQLGAARAAAARCAAPRGSPRC